MTSPSREPVPGAPPAPATAEPGWALLGKVVKERRDVMGLSRADVAARGGPSDYTLARIERGDSADYRPKTFVQLDRGLSWPGGASRRVLECAATESDLATVPAVPDLPAVVGTLLLGQLVKSRRKVLRLPIDLTGRGGPSEMTMRKIEAGVGVDLRPQTKNRLEHALRWRPGVVDRVLDGIATDDDLNPRHSGSLVDADAHTARALRIGQAVLVLMQELAAEIAGGAR